MKKHLTPAEVLAQPDDDDQTTSALVSPSEINMAELEPGEVNPNDVPDVPKYNPLNHVYPVVIEELNMEVVIKFHLEELSHDEKNPLVFTNKAGEQTTLAFFPRKQEGMEPSGDEDYYKDCEYHFYIYPAAVRAKVFGDPLANNGEGTSDVLVSREFLRQNVSPERMAQALEAYRDEVHDDPTAPFGLKCLLDDALGYGNQDRTGPEDYSGSGWENGNYDSSQDDDWNNDVTDDDLGHNI